MKILFICPYAPNLIRTRPYNLLRALAQRGHDITLGTLWQNEAERQDLAELAQLGIRVLAARLTRGRSLWNTLQAAPSGLPLQARFCWQPALAAQLSGSGDYDVAHVEHLRGAEYARWLQARLRAAGAATPVVWDSVDCISLLFEQAAQHSDSRFGRWMARLELPRTRRYEAAMVRQLGNVLATSPFDQAALRQLAGEPRPGQPPIRIEVLPNGVDSSYFVPPAVEPQPVRVVLTGKMSYHANVTAAMRLVNDIMPHVWRQRPDAQVVLAGSAPPREVRALAERHASRVQVTGFVPDLRPYLQSAAVAAAPIRYGAGIQNKVLEAMACGLPVVASPQASSALAAQPGQDLLLAATDSEFASALVRVLNEPALRRQIGAAGRQYAVTHHRWDGIASRLEGLYDELIGASAQHAGRGDRWAKAPAQH